MSGENSGFKRLGLHYNTISNAGGENELLGQRN
jgi:hypothetical protein